jgi:hypothetical protein
MTEQKLDAMAKALTARYKAGPQTKKPGEMSASDWGWWNDFWKERKGMEKKLIEEDVVEEPTPQRKSAEGAARGMDNKTLLQYCYLKGWITLGKGGAKGTAKEEKDPGAKMVQDVCRDEWERRGRKIKDF